MQSAKYGAQAFQGKTDKLPDVFPRTMGPNCLKYLKEIVDSGLTSNMISRFEQAFAKEIGVKHCIGTPGCTPALHILMAGAGFKHGDEIIVSPITDYGTVMGMLCENYIPVFADTEPGSINISAKTIESLITERTRAILVVHKMGIPCDMDPILALAKRHNLFVFEDVCQAIFSEYKGRYTGTFGIASGFSFDAEKTMGSDIGGAVITDDDELAERLRFIGHSRGGINVQGFGRIHTERGLALRMTMSTAAISLGQLEIIKEQVNKRDRTARLLTERLAGIKGIIPYKIPDYCTKYSCWMYGFSVEPGALRCTPEEFAEQLKELGLPNVGLGKYYLMPESISFLKEYVKNNIYPFSVPPASRQYKYDADSTPDAKRFLETFIRWFWTEKYEKEHIDFIYDIIKKGTQILSN